MQAGNVAGPEALRPVRRFELVFQVQLLACRAARREDAVVEESGEAGAILQVRRRLALGVQQPLDGLDDRVAARQEQLEQFDVGQATSWERA